MKRKIGWMLLAFVVGGVFLVAALLWGVSTPRLEDGCLPGYERCMGAANGMAEQVDCRIETFHCRIHGPDHWELGHD